MDSGKRTRPRFSLDLLRSFEVAARHLSFTQAAQELSLTQSAVSRGIKTLEDQLGQTLFARVHRGLRLTDAGESFYRSIGEAFKLIDDATDRRRVVDGHHQRAVGLRLAGPEAAALSSPASGRRGAQPGRQHIDLALRWSPTGSSVPGAQPLFDMSMFPVCAPALARDPARPLRRPEDLRQHVLLDLDTQATRGRWSDWKPWLEAMQLDHVEPAGILRFSHYDQLIHAVIAGSGVGMGRHPHSVSPLREGLLVAPFGRVAILGDAGAAPTLFQAVEKAAQSVGIETLTLKVERVPNPDFDGAFQAAKQDGANAVVVLSTPVTTPNRKRIAELAVMHTLPTLSPRDHADSGGLLSYGTSFVEATKHSAAVVDKILRGAEPGDLPVERVSRHELIVNLATARNLGFSIPAATLASASQVLQ
jgi:LysR family glycine cleavage system transcriptional activator